MSLLTDVMDFLDSSMRIGMRKTNGHLIQAKQVAKQVVGKPYKWGGSFMYIFSAFRKEVSESSGGLQMGNWKLNVA